MITSVYILNIEILSYDNPKLSQNLINKKKKKLGKPEDGPIEFYYQFRDCISKHFLEDYFPL